MPHTTKILNLCAIAFFVSSFSALAQNKANEKDRRGTGTRISVQESFEPTFRIEPLSHRINGRGGDIIPFKFAIESANRDTTIEVVPIGLKQELTGMILHDAGSPQADAIRLITPTKMNLSANKSSSIEGVLRVPSGDAKHHSLGIMVKDVGDQTNVQPTFDATGKRNTQAAIRFITQYVLRLDLEIDGVRGEQGQRLIIEDVKLTPWDGRPRLQALVSNPTDTTFEFELRAKLGASPSDRSVKPLRLVMPVRNGVSDDTRFQGRILPKSRIRMEELLPEAIAGGRFEAEVELIYDGRTVSKKSFPIDVDPEDYPAQEVLITQVAGGLQVSPSQIELSQIRGGNRRLTLLFKNIGKEDRSVKLRAMSYDDLDLPAAMFQPEEFRLAPGASRKIALTMKGQIGGDQSTEYGYVLIETKSEKKDYIESKKLPLALIYKKPSNTRIGMSPLVWDPSGKYPCFRTTVENSGNSHMPIDARLTVTAELGGRIQIPGGFGKWLMPSTKSPLTFRVDNALAPGNYQLKCELQTGGEPAVIEQTFTVTDIESAAGTKPVSTNR
ncbi:MAG: hypothetical protein ABL921_10270 [Pirellula sp.]